MAVLDGFKETTELKVTVRQSVDVINAPVKVVILTGLAVRVDDGIVREVPSSCTKGDSFAADGKDSNFYYVASERRNAGRESDYKPTLSYAPSV